MFLFVAAVSGEQVPPLAACRSKSGAGAERSSYLQAEALDLVETVRGRHPDCGRPSRGLQSRLIKQGRGGNVLRSGRRLIAARHNLTRRRLPEKFGRTGPLWYHEGRPAAIQALTLVFLFVGFPYTWKIQPFFVKSRLDECQVPSRGGCCRWIGFLRVKAAQC